jgi:hypothetical protein
LNDFLYENLQHNFGVEQYLSWFLSSSLISTFIFIVGFPGPGQWHHTIWIKDSKLSSKDVSNQS